MEVLLVLVSSHNYLAEKDHRLRKRDHSYIYVYFSLSVAL